jgi:hypothetical protein
LNGAGVDRLSKRDFYRRADIDRQTGLTASA